MAAHPPAGTSFSLGFDKEWLELLCSSTYNSSAIEPGTTPEGADAMSELLAVVTRKGQVTIPAEVRKALELKRGDVVAFTLPNSPTDATTVRRAPAARTSVVEQLFGSLHSNIPALTPAEEKGAYERAVALEADTHPEHGTLTDDHA